MLPDNELNPSTMRSTLVSNPNSVGRLPLMLNKGSSRPTTTHPEGALGDEAFDASAVEQLRPCQPLEQGISGSDGKLQIVDGTAKGFHRQDDPPVAL